MTPARLLNRGDDVAVIPGTERVDGFEDARAGAVTLDADDVRHLDELAPAVGERHEAAAAARTNR